MNSISFASTIAMAVGLGAAFPQILRMLASRSANGQSPLGWAMGLIANTSMAYVNIAGFHAHLLAASNLLSATFCVTAMLLITRFAGSSDAEIDSVVGEVAAAPEDDLAFAPVVARSDLRVVPPVHEVLADLPTTEFVALRAAIDEIDAFRADRARRDDKLTFAA